MRIKDFELVELLEFFEGVDLNTDLDMQYVHNLVHDLKDSRGNIEKLERKLVRQKEAFDRSSQATEKENAALWLNQHDQAKAWKHAAEALESEFSEWMPPHIRMYLQLARKTEDE